MGALARGLRCRGKAFPKASAISGTPGRHNVLADGWDWARGSIEQPQNHLSPATSQ